MGGLGTVHSCVLVIGLLILTVDTARADVSPGDVIDQTNWEKAQGLLPEPVLEWVKEGDFILNIEKPNFELADCFPPFQIEAFRTSVGKYELDADGGIIEVKAGKRQVQGAKTGMTHNGGGILGTDAVAVAFRHALFRLSGCQTTKRPGSTIGTRNGVALHARIAMPCVPHRRLRLQGTIVLR